MSYDVRIAVKVEGCGQYIEIDKPPFDDPTYNLRDMFVACMDWDYEQGKYYRCSEVFPKIGTGLNKLYYEDFSKYDSPNGWGTTSIAKDFLNGLIKCILKNAEEIPMECLYMKW